MPMFWVGMDYPVHCKLTTIGESGVYVQAIFFIILIHAYFTTDEKSGIRIAFFSSRKYV
jgi:hypothetical protein